MKLKQGTWLENIKTALLTILSALPLGYLAIRIIDGWLLSVAKTVYLMP